MTQWGDLGPADPWPGATTIVVDGTIIVGADGGIDYVWIAHGFTETGGETGSSEPVWDHTAGTMADGLGAWDVIDAWQAASPYTSTDIAQPTVPNGHAYQALGSGESGPSEPSPWETDGISITDDGGTGSANGDLIPPDPDDNDDGTGTSGFDVDADVIYQVWPNPKLVYDGDGVPDLDGGHPGRDQPPLGVLTELNDDKGRRVRNNAGELYLQINAHAEQAAWLVQGNIVVAYRDSLDSPPFASYILDQRTVTILDPDEEGAEIVEWECTGTLSMLRDFSLLYRSLLPNADELRASPEDDDDGRWHWLHKLPIAMLTRILEEQRYFGTFYYDGIANSPCPSLMWDFGRHIDSAGDSVDNEDADAFALAVGLNVYQDVLPAFMQIGLLVRDKPVINGDGHLRILLQSWVDDPGIDTGITFEKGVDLVELGQQVLAPLDGGSFIQVEGQVQDSGVETNRHKYVTRDDTGLRERFGTIVSHVSFNATHTNRFLQRVGDRILDRTTRKLGGPGMLQFLESEGKVAFLDFVEWDRVHVTAQAGPYGWNDHTDRISAIAWERQENGSVAWGLEFGDDEPIGLIEIKNACECVAPATGGSG